MSRNGFSMAPRKAARWTSHLRQFSRATSETLPEEEALPGEMGPSSPYQGTPQSSLSPQRPQSPDSVSSNATIREPFSSTKQTPKFERICTVTVNEAFSREEVMVNLDHFDDSVQPGQLMAIDVLPDQRPNFGSYRRTPMRKDEHASSSAEAADAATTSSAPTADGAASQPELNTQRRYLFIVNDMDTRLKSRHPSVEIYVAKHIADAFGMKKNSSVLLTRVDASNPAIEASHVELVFKDQYLSRADMWRLAVAELSERTIYSGQRVLFMSTIKATVTNVYVEGRRTQSAFFGKNTRPIFRSESARYVLFIQMAREMWDFDSDGSGEIMFSKVVNVFLPTLFKTWAARLVKHLVTIVLFARVEYDAGLSFDLSETSVRQDYYTGVQSSGNRRPYKDFYRVVVSEMASGEWTRILHQLKREFNMFRRDISLHHLTHLRPDTAASMMDEATKKPSTAKQQQQQQHIQAESTPAMYGNVLEAIHMATSLYAYDYVDRDLTRTGISVAIITPGSGVFEVDYDAMRRTTEAVIGNGIGIDLICLPKMPLHCAPLFRFRHPRYLERGMGKTRAFSSHSQSQDRSPGISGSTPKQATALFGSYSSIGGSSLSPSKATDATVRGYEPVQSDRLGDTWSYAFPQWLHVSYLASEPGELLMRQGVPPPPIANYDICADGRVYEKEFSVRCRMYDLQMRGVLETNEIETAPLHSDLLFPRSAFRPSAGSPKGLAVERDGILHVRNKLPANVLYDQVYGFQRFSADKIAKQDAKSLWKQLQEYDGTRQKLPTTRRNAGQAPVSSSRRELVDTPSASSTTLRTALKKQHLLSDADATGREDRELSMKSSRNNRLRTVSSAEPTGLGTERKMRDTRTPPGSGRDSVSSQSSSKMPKVMRQISLGQRGFGVAAPKAAVAEISAETVAAAVAHLAPPSIMGPTAIGTPKALAITAAPGSSFAAGSGFPKTDGMIPGSLQRSASGISIAAWGGSNGGGRAFHGVASQPIVIRSGQGGPTDVMVQRVAGSPLSTTMIGRGGAVPGQDRDVKYSNALRAEDDVRLYNSKLLAEAVPEVTKILSPTEALMPWLAMINPSKPEANRIDLASFNSRWQHVFPRPGEQRAMKWKTLCAPAAVPLTTESFPSKEQLQSEYQRQPYSVSMEADDDMLSEEPVTNEDLLRELISRRFAQGFQVVIGPAVAKAFGLKQLKIADIFCPGRFIEDGESIFMCMGNTIHQLSCTKAAGVEVNIFQRKTAELGSNTGLAGGGSGTMSIYRPAIRTLLDRDYETSEIDLVPQRAERNWNYIDSYLAGHDEQLKENLRFWRARFVLIPMSAKSATATIGDSEEELRLEGIRRLGQLWQKHRVVPTSERRFQHVGHRRKGTNPLDVVYKTEDPSLVIAAELETLPLFEGLDPGNRKGQLVTSREQFRKGSLNLALLAEAIQQPVENGGIRMQNRRWHLRLHHNCFIGSDMTSWLLDNFEDLESREEAEELGNMLMISDEVSVVSGKGRDKEPEEAGPVSEGSTETSGSGGGDSGARAGEGSEAGVGAGVGVGAAAAGSSTKDNKRGQGIFVHVERRHPFRDGQYFYQIGGEFAKPHLSSWFNARRREVTTPSTPMTTDQTGQREATRAMPWPVAAYEDTGPTSGASTPTVPVPSGKKPRVVLSKVIKYDVDHRRRSYRPERVDLHYDRLHNPDNCYHIRLEWMNVTAKLIEDVIESWTREALQFGLRLVEVPIHEGSLISERNPFRRPYLVRLARQPPMAQPSTYFDPNSLAPRQLPGRHFYQKAMLRKFGFVLDTEAASNFPANVDVSYSWGRPDYKYTQYIHRSGVALAEITTDGDFLLLANRLYSSRTTVRESNARSGEPQQQAPSQPPAAQGTSFGKSEATPLQSPMLKSTRFGSPRMRAVGTETPTKMTGSGSGPGSGAASVSGSGSGSGPGPGSGIGIGLLHKASAATGAVGTAGLSAAAAAAAVAAATAPYVVEPEAIMEELETFCSDEAALEMFYRETLLERQVGSVTATPVVGPLTAAAAAAAAAVAAVPDTSIPALGLPPGILSSSSSIMGSGPDDDSGNGSNGNSNSNNHFGSLLRNANFRLDLGAIDSGTSSPSPRTASPAFLSSRLLFRRGSVDDYGRQQPQE